MRSEAKTVDQYIEELDSPDRKEGCRALRQVILRHLPEGFIEKMNYGMPSYVVPHSLYPAGYHCDSKLPLPFVSFASQKQHYSFYHMGIYSDEKLLNWFEKEYRTRVSTKLNRGKSCIKIRKMTPEILTLLGKLLEKITVPQWIANYENNVKR